MADTKVSALAEVSVPDLADDLYLVDDTGPTSYKVGTDRLLGLLPSVCDGRLTLTSGTPVTTADVTAATSIYFTPYIGDRIAIYDGTRWRLYAFAELTLALGTLTAALPYDVFIYDNAGTLTLEALAWTNGTTRATALVRQNGVWCKTGALTRRYLGTFYTTATTTTEDSEAKRFLWNAYNRVEKVVSRLTTGTWTYQSVTIRQANATAANKIEIVAGLAESYLRAALPSLRETDAGPSYGNSFFGIDSTTTLATSSLGGHGPAAVSLFSEATALFKQIVSIGYHYLAWLEANNNATSAVTYYGDGGGVTGLRWGILGGYQC